MRFVKTSSQRECKLGGSRQPRSATPDVAHSRSRLGYATSCREPRRARDTRPVGRLPGRWPSPFPASSWTCGFWPARGSAAGSPVVAVIGCVAAGADLLTGRGPAVAGGQQPQRDGEQGDSLQVGISPLLIYRHLSSCCPHLASQRCPACLLAVGQQQDYAGYVGPTQPRCALRRGARSGAPTSCKNPSSSRYDWNIETSW